MVVWKICQQSHFFSIGVTWPKVCLPPWKKWYYSNILVCFIRDTSHGYVWKVAGLWPPERWSTQRHHWRLLCSQFNSVFWPMYLVFGWVYLTFGTVSLILGQCIWHLKWCWESGSRFSCYCCFRLLCSGYNTQTPKDTIHIVNIKILHPKNMWIA